MPEEVDEFEQVANRLRQCVRARLREGLQSKLEYANLDHVLSLCMNQLRHSSFSSERIRETHCEAQGAIDHNRWIEVETERICQETLENSYVRDCELIAQYLQDKKAEPWIRERYWQEYSTYTETVVWAVLTRRYGKREAEVRLPQAQCEVDEKVFAKGGFQKLLKGYKADGGMTFERFLKRRILWRTRDIAGQDALNVVECELPECEDKAIHEDGMAKERATGEKGLLRALEECLEELQSHYCGDPDRGNQECAAFELRFVALRSPDVMISLMYVMQASGRDKAFFVKEYEAANEAASELEHDLTPAELDRDRTRLTADICRRVLENTGYTLEQIDVLCAKALRDTLKKMKECEKSTYRSHRPEFEFMTAYRRYDRAKRKLESLLTSYWKKSVRSETYIGELLGLPQPTTSRRLNSALKFLRECLTSKGFAREEDLPAGIMNSLGQ